MNFGEQIQALTQALYLALIAPTDHQSRLAVQLGDQFAVGLSSEAIENCKAKALQMAIDQDAA